jgi:hypothetical protein
MEASLSSGVPAVSSSPSAMTPPRNATNGITFGEAATSHHRREAPREVDHGF